LRDDHDLVLEGDGMQQELPYSSVIEAKKKKPTASTTQATFDPSSP